MLNEMPFLDGSPRRLRPSREDPGGGDV